MVRPNVLFLAHRVPYPPDKGDRIRTFQVLRKNGRARLIGPNCPGVLSPGKANVGIIPASFFSEGNVGVVSRSGTLTYQIGNVLAQRGFVVDDYRDHAIGTLGKNADGKMAMTTIALRPAIVFSGQQPSADELEAIHHASHDKCYVANSLKTDVVVEDPL